MSINKKYGNLEYVRILPDAELLLSSEYNEDNEDETEVKYVHKDYRPELLSSKNSSKTKRWILVVAIFIVAIGCIVGSYVLLQNEEDLKVEASALIHKRSLTLEDFLHGKFFAHGFNGTWISDTELMYVNSGNNLLLRQFLVSGNQSVKVLLKNTDPLSQKAYHPTLSADRKYLLIAQVQAQLYRYSKISRYTVVNLETNENVLLTVEGNADLHLVVWAPVGHGLALVYKNNLFYKENPNALEIRITNDPEYVFNGIPDWVYEEEILNSDKALWFSPDGKRLAFAKYDDRNIPLMLVPYFGEPGTAASKYPRVNALKYPKAGVPNPIVSLSVVDLSDLTRIHNLEPPSALAIQEPILSGVQWANNETLAAFWLNRVQNESSFIAYNVNSSGSFILKNIREHRGWIEISKPIIFNKNATQYVIILSQDQGGIAGSYKHITLVNVSEDAVGEALTKGKFVVTRILGWNENDDLVYYLANTEEDPGVQHVYSVSTVTKEITCLSCGVRRNNSTEECLFNTAYFSEQFSYHALSCEGPSVPYTVILSKSHKKLLNWEDNTDLLSYTKNNELPIIQRFKFNITDNLVAQVRLQLPPNYDPSGKTKYPLLINVYGGPDTTQVNEEFLLNWGSYLASNKSIIYGVIDGRGSGLKGDNMLFAGYRNIGTVEVEDQIEVTKKIQALLPFVDKSKTAIWGWSYGGYAAGMALATDKENVFKCGMSVAPVTDWALYDTIYTERFMGLPTLEDNLKGYLNAQLLTKYEGLRHKLYFLIHGTYDDNVHLQQSLLWAKVLEIQDIFFRQITYTDQVHDLGSVRPHLYHSLEHFLDECFSEENP